MSGQDQSYYPEGGGGTFGSAGPARVSRMLASGGNNRPDRAVTAAASNQVIRMATATTRPTAMARVRRASTVHVANNSVGAPPSQAYARVRAATVQLAAQRRQHDLDLAARPEYH